MIVADYAAKAQRYVASLCQVKPNRRTGSPGNQAATDFIARTIRGFYYDVDTTPFPCLDYEKGPARLSHAGNSYAVHTSPYSLGVDIEADLVAAATMAELKTVNCTGKILLMHKALCAEQIMPKNFVFYNPEHHQQLIALLEEKAPAAIITGTARQPDLVGAQYPFPLFVDGDFDIPSVYCRDIDGERLDAHHGERFHLQIDATRVSSQAANVIASINREARTKVVLTAHLDAYEDTPGASDNASGTAGLLLCAEMLADYQGPHQLEIAAFNGEDHYSVGGQMDYLRRYGHELPNIHLAVNVDDVGYKKGRASYSCYELAPAVQAKVNEVFSRSAGLMSGDPWFNGDHMIFVQNQVPAVAFTAEYMPELMRTVTHTAADTPDLLDYAKLVEIAMALHALVRAL